MAHELPALPYATNALEPHIDARTMEIHHDKHHQAYITNANNALKDHPDLLAKPVNDLIADLGVVPEAIRGPVRNNAGGHSNHSFFWTIMAPEGARGEVSPALMAAIVRDFGSMDGLRDQFRAASMNRFGSGWSWVVVNSEGRLVVGSTPNQDNPLMDDSPLRGMPILGNDVWEHAYYLRYQNRRAAYVDAWWSLINWGEVSRRFEAEIAGGA